MASLTITEAEILEAIARSQGMGDDSARTVQEMAAESGMSLNRVRQAIATFQKEGRLSVCRVRRPAIDGSSRVIPAYTILPKKGKK